MERLHAQRLPYPCYFMIDVGNTNSVTMFIVNHIFISLFSVALLLSELYSKHSNTPVFVSEMLFLAMHEHIVVVTEDLDPCPLSSERFSVYN